MFNRTPFRQISRIYSSLLALGRMPEESKAQAQELTDTLRVMTHAITNALAQSTEHRVAATRELVQQVRTRQERETAASTAAPLSARTHVPERLEQFRRELLGKIDPLLCIDVGARWGADSALLALKDNAKLLCFDPDEKECERLQREHPLDRVEYVPLALSSDGRQLSLTIAREPACSSIYPPVEALYQHYPACEEMTPAQVVSVPSTSLDRYLAGRGLGGPALYKLDTQGSELDILKGAIGNLSTACMIDIEVEFSPLYHGAALFSEVDIFLRSQGFALWRLPQMVHYAPQSFTSAETPLEAVAAPPWRTQTMNPGNGQLFWGQAHYVRCEFLATDPRQVSAALARRAAAVASAYGYWDLALMVLEKSPETDSEASSLRKILTSE